MDKLIYINLALEKKALVSVIKKADGQLKPLYIFTEKKSSALKLSIGGKQPKQENVFFTPKNLLHQRIVQTRNTFMVISLFRAKWSL